MHHTYKTQGTCSTQIDFDIEDNKIKNVVFIGGCNGNLKAVSKLVEGKNAQEIAELLKGNTCGSKPTSCADQLSKALLEAIQKENH